MCLLFLKCVQLILFSCSPWNGDPLAVLWGLPWLRVECSLLSTFTAPLEKDFKRKYQDMYLHFDFTFV